MGDLPPLRPYQDEAATIAVERGSLLYAMVMGAGKTRTALEAVERLASLGDVRSGCVFVLNSTKYQWKREIEQWTGQPCLVIDGDKRKRRGQYRIAAKYRYTVLNYECVVNDWEAIQEHLPIDFVICDEVTALKSFTSKRSKRLKEMGQYTAHRFGLSGQPVENRPEELFSIMEFIDPEVLGGFHKFDRTFIRRDPWGKPVSYRNLDLLRGRMAEAMFRRSREDLAEHLPRVVAVDTPVYLDDWSAKLYARVRDDVLDAIEAMAAIGGSGFDLLAHYGKADDSQNNRAMGELMGRLTVMRLLCDHPMLVERSARRFDDPETAGGSAYASALLQEGALDGAPATSAKLSALLESVEEILTESDANKVVVFSGFTSMLDLIEPELDKRRIVSARIDGSVPSAERDERIVRFNNDPKCRVFLSSDAGAYGVNLDQGSHLISYDLPWSSGAYAQRVARIDRLSSAHGSIVVDALFCAGTIEERQHQMLQQKRKVSEAVLDGKFDSDGVLTLDLASLKEFLAQ